MPITTCVFDAYGTLFDVAAAARGAVADHPALAERWAAIARDWRLKQLQYTWHRAVTGDHCDFWQVTQDGLDWALDAAGLDGDDALRERLLALYWTLDAFAEVPAMLEALTGAGKTCAILSNGSPAMLEGAVGSAGIGNRLTAVISVESVRVFKPARPVYDLVGQTLDVDPREVLFVSSNGWDAAAAGAYGFATAWVNRGAEPVDRLPAPPDHILTDLVKIPELV